jgi:hypothetical protein
MFAPLREREEESVFVISMWSETGCDCAGGILVSGMASEGARNPIRDVYELSYGDIMELF